MQTLKGVTRFDTSCYGNPRYQFVVDGEIVYTGVNSQHGYSITNYQGKEVTIEVKYIRNKLTLIDIK